MITDMVPRLTFTDPANGRKWVYFEYDGTYEAYKVLPNVIKMSHTFFIKTAHHSETFNVIYRQADENDYIIYKLDNGE